MTTAWNGRIQNAIDQDKRPFAIVWNNQIVEYDMIAIPKGAKNLDARLQISRLCGRTRGGRAARPLHPLWAGACRMRRRSSPRMSCRNCPPRQIT